MKLFGRRSKDASAEETDASPVPGSDEAVRPTDATDVDGETDETADGGAVGAEDDGFDLARWEPDEPAPSRANGPWDVSEKDEQDGYIDLGALRIPGRDGMELRLDIGDEEGTITAANIALGESVMQVQVFAAPRSLGIWAEIRAEIATGIMKQGGSADEAPGEYGRELIARLPVRSPDGRSAHQPARFVGIDGPRWFLRAVFQGPAAHDAAAAADLEDVLRGLVVNRGTDPMSPRELLPLHLPGAAQEAAAEDDETRAPLRPFERGPEITEVR